MPIHIDIPIRSISLEEFRNLDYQVMNHAFASQNAIGSLADERVYQVDFASRLLAAGFQVDREVQVILSHKTFQKPLYLDHVVNRQAVYELKVTRSLTDAHKGQLLTYLYLLNLERGKLINFASNKVESEFVNAAIPYNERIAFSVDRSEYNGSQFLLQMIVELVRDWGTSLSVSLYNEAIISMLGGPEKVQQMLPMRRDGIEIGNQRFCIASPHEAFQITAISKPNTDFKSHLKRLLRFSPLACLDWINIDHHQITFATIRK